ncbi:putative transcriptional regulator, TetR family [Nocardia nova SH22a]|uniref:Putative transcriptional regulator, TetR family n=1 Tax=Nocardia nova SH22a TaxID=1415166 RepID=W5T7B6_9NOCA|nr:TetR/AcrR family transcriptional regulator [Nocardia nova]AHH14838.1 putative transcriptional regulator, TetR family [Nocardia nova SH22a]
MTTPKNVPRSQNPQDDSRPETAPQAEAAGQAPKAPLSRKAAAQHRNRRQTTRLSYEDWVNGALDLLAREGVTAIRIPRLCQELGVTKGSFYWHFDDLEQLMAAMADRWGAMQAEAVRALADLDSIPVEARIEKMAAMLVDARHWMVEASVREWSRTDVTVAEAVRALDQRIFRTVQTIMLDLGFDPAQARQRAGAMVYLGIGLIHGRDNLPTPTPEEVQGVVDLLIRP